MTATCKFDKSKVAATIANWTAIPTDEDQIAAYTASLGPLSIGINAEWMQFYSHGVSNPLFCDAKKLDHGVLIVGYGTDGSTPYWKIKNRYASAVVHVLLILTRKAGVPAGVSRATTASSAARASAV